MNNNLNENNKTNIDFALANINIQTKNEWNNYERSINFLINNESGKEYFILFELIQRTCILSILQKTVKQEDHKTISYIGARVFNDGMVAFRSCMNGYYQIAMSIIRDLVEIQFLFDYFRSDLKQISTWRAQSNQDRYKNFAPHVLYKKLDVRDGWTGEIRKTTYQRFCEHAAHVSYPGIKLTADKKGVVSVGSFYDEKKILNAIYELDRRLGHAVISMLTLLPNTEILAIESQLKLMDKFAETLNLTLDPNSDYKKARKTRDHLLKKAKG